MPKDDKQRPRAVAVPAGRLHRLARMGGLAGQVAGSVAYQGLRSALSGDRRSLGDLVLTPANIERLTRELAQMRGAAMKIGQLISMEAGDVLPAEATVILSRLRDQAHFMPPAQLKQVLNAAWGSGWQRQFSRFDVRPVAAASIGQVHRARLRDGRDLAIKVQYPGVAASIDSDVANVGALLRRTRVLPPAFDIMPYLAAARAQLHEEVDYQREAAALSTYRDWLPKLACRDAFHVPAYHADWSTAQVLAMDYAVGHPIETLENAPPERRNKVMRDLFDLFFAELFHSGQMQSDPNFANFLYDAAQARVVLLDFGATRGIAPEVVQGYRGLLCAAFQGQDDTAIAAAAKLGFIDDTMAADHRARVEAMMRLTFQALRSAGVGARFDFADTTLSKHLQAEGMALFEDGLTPPPVEMDVLYVQRKLGGLALLATRLRAQVDLRASAAPYLG
ncbi:AarF/ABC1/UbiB kinase family protein [Thalassobius sp. Cn5-15]|uniref:ABC1 kinase family protein n=1 Tax=Thalassobius sp. Cn5-15 TaxID=2917763 RepID=UPI001EF2984E|nr:AarF/ABC1/UbiB kinase family protein [Thalassobius sp. Cn5-15]MCG7493533.1 AarF/ABC1/UbiB kinase family protein [Thalassobius sp. Cn5-15]